MLDWGCPKSFCIENSWFDGETFVNTFISACSFLALVGFESPGSLVNVAIDGS